MPCVCVCIRVPPAGKEQRIMERSDASEFQCVCLSLPKKPTPPAPPRSPPPYSSPPIALAHAEDYFVLTHYFLINALMLLHKLKNRSFCVCLRLQAWF